MGSKYIVKYVEKKDTQEQKFKDIEFLLKEINGIISTYEPESELSKFNKNTSTDWVKISPVMHRLLLIAKSIHQKSGGFYDITVGPAVNLWGFGPQKRDKVQPSDEEIQAVIQSIGLDKLEIDPTEAKIRKKIGTLYVDLSSIGQGYASDAIAAYLEDHNIKSYLVDVTGEMRIKGKKPDDTTWSIGIEAPIRDEVKMQKVMQLTDISLATSGDYRNFIKIGEEFFSHTIDPFTAKPIKHTLGAVTVFHKSATEADAWSTALMALGYEKGLEVAKKEGLTAYFLYRKDGEIKEEWSKELGESK